MKRFIALFVGLMAVSMLAQGAAAQSVEMNSAKLYKKQGEIDKAIEFFEKAIAKKPENAEAHYLLGELYGQTGRLADMIQEFDKSLAYSKKYEKEIQAQRQKHFADSFNTGVKAANESDYAKALQGFMNARLIEPQQIDSYKNLAFVYMRLDSIPAVLRVYHELLAIKPDDYETYLTMASLHNQQASSHMQGEDSAKAQAEFAQAAELLQKAVGVAPDSVRPRIIGELGITYDMMGRGDEAMKTYQDALKITPGNKDLLFNLGRLYLMRDDYANAISQLTEVLKLNPEDFEVNYNVGLSYLKIGERLDKKSREIEDEAMAAKKKPNTARIDSLRQAANEKFTAAMPYLKKAVEIKPDQGSAWHNLGVGYMRAGDQEKAKEAFAKADALEGQKN
jgi:tetratricopeptide (TPR) repeat protein